MKKAPPIVDVRNVDPLQIHVAAHGAMAAAWLVWQFRGMVKHAGAFLLHLPPKKEMPPWCRVALECLRQRPKKWDVQEGRISVIGGRQFVIRWLDWPRYSRRARVAQIVRA